MRCYRSLDVPGVDMLSDAFEFNTVKQCSSVARQNGARGVMSEIYGVTNWTFDFAGHKASGDWQAVLGITFRVHHLTWVSMAGEGKRDYPACIGYQSNWYKQYPYIEDHFSRLNVTLTRGKPVTRVAVIHPIESFWLCFGPMDSNADEMAYRDQAFEDLTKWLIFGLVDFDFVSESLLPEQCSIESITSNKLPVGKMEYEVVIVPNLRTIRSTTLTRLEKFTQNGGRVLVAGSQPSLVDAMPSPNGVVSTPYADAIQFSSFHILQALEPFRDVRIRTDEGVPSNKILYQMRDDGDNKYVFICNTDRVRYYPTKIDIRGEYEITLLDTFTGEERALSSKVANGWTTIEWTFEAIGSVLLRLSVIEAPKQASTSESSQQFVPRNSLRTLGTDVSLDQVTLSEPNVLLLDFCSYKIGSGDWSKEGEVLRLENDIRSELQLPLKLEALRQPWSQPEEKTKPKADVTVRFKFVTTTPIKGTQLAIEDAPNVRIAIDGAHLSQPTTVSGWWVDEDIHTVDLPPIAAGEHELELTYAFGLLTNIERVYLLGNFSVDIRGRETTIKPFDLKINFGDWTTMGLPFYAGNVTYHCSFSANTQEDQDLWLELPSPPATFVADAVTTDVVGETDVEEENVATGVVVGNDELNEELTGAADSEVVSTAVLETATLVAEISTELV
ncbi:putative glycoside hydrolase family 2 protein [Phaeoacremonium minimum UCRPA7]|uniref:Putative glycoside hydrolase family 2 protein n=1 Tax=Phaeoacremonium minimum (strain UCR-PA7) TaxID=1286976 RepID=R8BLW0_PHAM7|nr:putative glycoside hydrolase family 2 protein [Phaeoacremonium minimum UCRPA7]EOO00275.1 putative glycoside hydrolase family 2 protein [Phaeoacremonium minimum UCRPA7]